jgi:hypothetical protein
MGAKRRIFFDMHFPDWPQRQTATNFDLGGIVSAFAGCRADSVILYAKCQYGNFYYDTKLGHKHGGLGSLNLFAEVSRGLKARGVEVIAYYSVAWDEWQAEKHPEYLTVDARGGTERGESRWHTLCVNSPYRDEVKAHLREICDELKPDGFWLDMAIIGHERCFCPCCREKFKALYGFELTPEAVSGPEARNAFKEFRYNYIEEFYREAYAIIRGRLPNSIVTNNYWGYPYSSWEMGSRAVGALRNADFATGEAYADWTGLSAPAFFSKFLRGVADGRPFEALIGRFCNTWDYTAKPAAQLALEAYTVASHGGTVTIDDEPYASGELDMPLYRDIGAIFSEMRRREAYLSGACIRHAAILHSQASKDAYHDGSQRFITAVAGAYRLLKELQAPTEFLFEETLSPALLSGLEAVLLPSVAVMEPSTLDMLWEFAEGGGLVIASGETALFRADGHGLARSSALEERIGLAYEGMSDFTVSYIEHGERPVTVRGRYAKYSGCASPCARIIDPICETGPDVFFHNNLPAPYETSEYPAIIAARAGKGAFILFAQDVFSQFAKSHSVDLKNILGGVFQKYGKSPAITHNGASNIEFVASELDGRLVLNFVNFTPGMAVCCGFMDTLAGEYPRTLEFVERVNPVADFEVELRGLAVKSAIALSSGEPLAVAPADGRSVIRVPKLGMWETIVAEVEAV